MIQHERPLDGTPNGVTAFRQTQAAVLDESKPVQVGLEPTPRRWIEVRGLALDTMMLATYVETGRDRAEREAWLRNVRENMAAVLSAIETVATCSGNLIHREGRSA